MRNLILILAALFLVCFTTEAFAVPVVDGINSLGEWTVGLLADGSDLDEGDIPNAYDFERIAMFHESGGSPADDGLYILIDLYGVPTFTSLDTTPPFNPVVYGTSLDLNSDGDFTDSVDRNIDFRASGFTVFDGLGGVVAGSPSFVMGSVVEYYIPSSMFSGSFGAFNSFSELDNGGQPSDDRLPDVGFQTVIPEPTAMFLFGVGILGLLGLKRRKV